jgi:hypothetical protein
MKIAQLPLNALIVIIGCLSIAFLSGCYMTPEDKAFYGRGWINPNELDQDQAPPRSFNDPTAVEPQPLPPPSGY